MGGDLKPLRVSSSPLSSSAVSWKTPGSFSSSTPSNPTRGNYGHNGTNGLRDGRDIGVD